MIIPNLTSLKNFSSSLIIDFPDDNIIILDDKNNWKEWGDQLVQSESFIQNSAPGTQNYNNWKDWAQDLFFVMNNNP